MHFLTAFAINCVESTHKPTSNSHLLLGHGTQIVSLKKGPVSSLILPPWQPFNIMKAALNTKFLGSGSKGYWPTNKKTLQEFSKMKTSKTARSLQRLWIFFPMSTTNVEQAVKQGCMELRSIWLYFHLKKD